MPDPRSVTYTLAVVYTAYMLYVLVDFNYLLGTDDCDNLPDFIREPLEEERPVRFKDPRMYEDPQRYGTKLSTIIEQDIREGRLDTDEKIRSRMRELLDQLFKARLIAKHVREDGTVELNITNNILDIDIEPEEPAAAGELDGDGGEVGEASLLGEGHSDATEAARRQGRRRRRRKCLKLGDFDITRMDKDGISLHGDYVVSEKVPKVIQIEDQPSMM